jgi:serine/threonine protein kinase
MFGRLFPGEERISAPLEVTHVLHLDSSLNWSFDASVDPRHVFKQVRVIGKGGFGVVWQIVHGPSMKILAGKIINPTLVDDKTRSEIEAEIALMRDVESPYTVKYYGSVKYDGSLMILMEYCEGGSLRDLLDSRERVLAEDQIAIVLYDLLKGLQLIHTRHRIVHRDIKAANILLTADGLIKIADFGVSRRFDSGRCQTVTIVGTPYWMAPEVISGVSYSFPADLWSVGITAVELAEGAPPYIELAPTKAMVEIAVKGFPGYRFPTMHSAEFCDFVSHCVMQNPHDRWTITELMEHPFIKRATRLPRADVLADMLVPRAEPSHGGSPGTFSIDGDHAPAEIASATLMEDSKASSPASFGSELVPSGDEFASGSSFRPNDSAAFSGTFSQDDAKSHLQSARSVEARPPTLAVQRTFSSISEIRPVPKPGSESSNSETVDALDAVKDPSGRRPGQGVNSVMSPRRPKISSQPFSHPEYQPNAGNAMTVAPNAPFVRMGDQAATHVYQPFAADQPIHPVIARVNFWVRIRRSNTRPFIILIVTVLLLTFFGVEGFVGGAAVLVTAYVLTALRRDRAANPAPVS